MLLSHFVVSMLLASLMISGVGSVYSQDFPTKPIRILTGETGGAGDITGRLLAEGLRERFGQPVIIENRAITASNIVAKALPDAYTLLLDGGSFWIAPLLQATPYDVIRDFLPISQTISSIYVLVVHPSLPVKSVKELIALAKARPGDLNYGSSGAGASNHLAAELFKSMTNVNIVRIAYKGGGPALNALIAGQGVQMLFVTGTLWAPHASAGRLRALAISSRQPSPLAPGLPTIEESGLPGYEALNIQGVFAPAKTPAVRINQLSQELVRILSHADVKERLLTVGLEAKGSSPQEFAALIKSELGKWGKLIKDAGIRAE